MPKSKKCIFLGYGNSSEIGSHLWDPKARKIVQSNDVYFNEKKMHKKPVPLRRLGEWCLKKVNP